MAHSRLCSAAHEDRISPIIAALAHACWCERMLVEGWTPGRCFDEASRRHDALVPFDELSQSDQMRAIQSITLAGIKQALSRAIMHRRSALVRSPYLEYCIDRRVTSTIAHDASGAFLQGRISDRATCAEMETVEMVRITWDDGDVTEHCPDEGEVRPV